jgi:hypothetical protein
MTLEKVLTAWWSVQLKFRKDMLVENVRLSILISSWKIQNMNITVHAIVVITDSLRNMVNMRLYISYSKLQFLYSQMGLLKWANRLKKNMIAVLKYAMRTLSVQLLNINTRNKVKWIAALIIVKLGSLEMVKNTGTALWRMLVLKD